MSFFLPMDQSRQAASITMPRLKNWNKAVCFSTAMSAPDTAMIEDLLFKTWKMEERQGRKSEACRNGKKRAPSDFERWAKSQGKDTRILEEDQPQR
mmetsp:Transcript_883/g.1909  ORF Transcript_883/g.1909 Transcript_883/m.1909 type:complete len:96 (-) Transcript_883:1569-1856(-)